MTRTIDFNDLAKYGMNRFGVKLTIEQAKCEHSECQGTHLTELKTFPLRDNRTETLIAEFLPKDLSGMVGSFELSVDSTGAFRSSMTSRKDDDVFRGVLIRGRDRYYTELDRLYDPELLSEQMDAVATEIINRDIPLDKVQPVVLPADQFGIAALSRNVAIVVPLVNEKSGEVAVPGAYADLPGDFQADFNAKRLDEAPGLIRAAIPRVLPKLKERLTARLERLNRLERELS